MGVAVPMRRGCSIGFYQSEWPERSAADRNASVRSILWEKQNPVLANLPFAHTTSRSHLVKACQRDPHDDIMGNWVMPFGFLGPPSLMVKSFSRHTGGNYRIVMALILISTGRPPFIQAPRPATRLINPRVTRCHQRICRAEAPAARLGGMS